MPNSELVQSLLKGLDLLQLVSRHIDGIRLNELVAETGLKKPTLHNLLRTLCARNFLVRDSINRFHIGPAALEIADNQRSAARRTRAAELLLEMSELFPGKTITLSRLTGPEIQCIFRISPDLPGELQRPADRNFMPYVSATAIVLQAANPVESAQLEEHYPFDEYGIGMWGSPENFQKAKEQVMVDHYFLRDTGRLITMAFVMPDGFALGFSFPCGKKINIDHCIKAAANYRRNVWGG